MEKSMNPITNRKVFTTICDSTLFVFLGVLLAFGRNNPLVVFLVEIFFSVVFGIRFLTQKSKITTFAFWSLGLVVFLFYATVHSSSSWKQAIALFQVLVIANLLIPYMQESDRNYRFFLYGLLFGACLLFVRLLVFPSNQHILTGKLEDPIFSNIDDARFIFSITTLVAFSIWFETKKWYFGIISIVLYCFCLGFGSPYEITILLTGLISLGFFTRAKIGQPFIYLVLSIGVLSTILYLIMHGGTFQRFLVKWNTPFAAFFSNHFDSGTPLHNNMLVQGWRSGFFPEASGYGRSIYFAPIGFMGTLWFYSFPLMSLIKGIKMFFTARAQNGTSLSLTLLIVLLFATILKGPSDLLFLSILLTLCYVGVAGSDAKSGKSIQHIFRKAKEWLLSPRLLVLHMLKWKIARFLPDTVFVAIKYRMSLKKKLNLKDPKTYNEKLQWLKIYDRQKIYTKFVDKYEVRAHIANTIGSEYLIPLIGVYDRVEDIDFELLPSSFVLKPTQTSGDVIICRDKSKLNWQKTKRELYSWMGKNYYWYDREWPYKDIKARIVCEQLIETTDGKTPKDYKIFCFDGIPKFAFVASDRGEATKFDYFDVNWNRMPVMQHYPNSSYDIPKPKQWDKMLSLAMVLSAKMPHVRVDFYIDANEHILFGELTFFHFSGFVEFEPDHYDQLLGDWLKLPEKSNLE
jgi:hypothetical protein